MTALVTPRVHGKPGKRSAQRSSLLLAVLYPLSAVERVVLWLGGYHYDPIDMTHRRFWYYRELMYKHWLLAPCEVIAVLVCVAAVFVGLPTWLVIVLVVSAIAVLVWSLEERSKNARKRHYQNFHADQPS